MRLQLLSLLTGVACGAAFEVLRFPIPAPSKLAGIVGIAGIFIGAWAIRALRG